MWDLEEYFIKGFNFVALREKYLCASFGFMKTTKETKLRFLRNSLFYFRVSFF